MTGPDELDELEKEVALRLAAWGLRQRAGEHERAAARIESLYAAAQDAAKRSVESPNPGSSIATIEHRAEAAAYRAVWSMLQAERKALAGEAGNVEAILRKREAADGRA